MNENSASLALEYAIKRAIFDKQDDILYNKSKIYLPNSNMTIFDITSLSSKGQIVIPNSLRKELRMVPGAKMIIFSDGVNVLLKPVQEPKMEKFKKLINESRAFMRKKNIKRSDVQKTIKQIRNENRS